MPHPVEIGDLTKFQTFLQRARPLCGNMVDIVKNMKKYVENMKE